MRAARWLSVGAGVLFILATVSAVVASRFVPDLESGEYLSALTVHAGGVAIAAILYLVAAFASVGIAVTMYPVMRMASAGLALGSVVFRALEAAFYMVAVACLLSIASVGERFASAAAGDRAPLAAVADALASVRGHASLLAVFAVCVGASLYYVLFFQARYVPRWLSVWGMAAVASMLVACVMALSADRQITSYVALALPLGVQEMALAAWLIAVGFRLPVAAEGGGSPRGASAPPAVTHPLRRRTSA